MTNYKINVDHSNLQDRKVSHEFAEEMNFAIRNIGRKSDGDRSFVKLLKSPASMAFGISKVFLPSDPNELCDILRLSLQKTHAGNNSGITIQEIVAIVDKFFEYKCLSKEQHKQHLIESNLLHEQV